MNNRLVWGFGARNNAFLVSILPKQAAQASGVRARRGLDGDAGDQHRIERAVSVAKNIQDDLGAVRCHRFLAAAFAPVGRLVLSLRGFPCALLMALSH